MRLIITLILLPFISFPAAGQQFGWRGPDRSGIYKEYRLMKKWPSTGPLLLWETTGIGMGHSSATVTDDAIYITGQKGEKDVLTSFDQDGKKNWEVIYGNSATVVSAPESFN